MPYTKNAPQIPESDLFFGKVSLYQALQERNGILPDSTLHMEWQVRLQSGLLVPAFSVASDRVPEPCI